MTLNEVKKTCDDLKRQGYQDEDIERAFSVMFIRDVIDLQQLKNLYALLNLKLKPEFLEMSKEQQKAVLIRRWDLDNKKDIRVQ